MMQDDREHTGRRGDYSDEFSLEELIADFAATDDNETVEVKDEGAGSLGDFGFALDESGDREETTPTEEIDADATGEYSRIISEYASMEENPDEPDEQDESFDAETAAEITDSAETADAAKSSDAADIDEDAAPSVSEEAASPAGTVRLDEGDGTYAADTDEAAEAADNANTFNAFIDTGHDSDESAGDVEGLDIDGLDETTGEYVIEDMGNADFSVNAAAFSGPEPEAPTLAEAVGYESSTSDSDDDIPDLADLRNSISSDDDMDGDEPSDADSDLYEKLELGPVIDDLPMDESDGDTVGIPDFDPDDPLGLLGRDDAAPPQEQGAAENGNDQEDFLGLGSVKTGVRKGAAAEVQFDGVSMSFDDQIGRVTLAEVLLAQGNRDDAAELYEQVAGDGTTFWVEKRLEDLKNGG